MRVSASRRRPSTLVAVVARIYRGGVAAGMVRPRGDAWSKAMRRAATAMGMAPMLAACGCTTVDPGPNFSIANTSFDGDYFYCHVEPQFIVAKHCGPGGPSDSNSCHFVPSAVSGMVLLDHPPVDCGGGDHPVDTTQIGTGSPAQSNLEAVSFEMSKDYTTAPIYVRPSGSGNALYHPRQIFDPGDVTVIQLLSTWASK